MMIELSTCADHPNKQNKQQAEAEGWQSRISHCKKVLTSHWEEYKFHQNYRFGEIFPNSLAFWITDLFFNLKLFRQF